MNILSFSASLDTATASPRTPTPAQRLAPQQRQQLAREALAGRAHTTLAEQYDVSRKFVAQQVQRAEQALDDAFAPSEPAAETVLFTLPVTRAWLHSVSVALVLTCHSSLRGVQELLHDRFDYDSSLGTVANALRRVVPTARAVNAQQDLSPIRLAALDELFQVGWPVLVGADVASTYCFLLSQEEHRAGDTWAIRLWELQDQGLAPAATIADGGTGLRAGPAQALQGVPCRAAVFHVERECGQLVTFLDNRAYRALAAAAKLARQAAAPRAPAQTRQHAAAAQHEADRAVTLADTVAVLAQWLRQDVLAVAGPPLADRRLLYDFLVAELRTLAPQCAHRIDPIVRLLMHQRDDLLAFAGELDRDLEDLARYAQVPLAQVRELLQTLALPPTTAARWQRAALLRQALGCRFHTVSQLVTELAAGVVRARSVIENLNSRLRSAFFLRRHLGADYLELLRFYLNHHRFLRSDHPERVGKSPAELLNGQPHAPWLELLGFPRFRRTG